MNYENSGPMTELEHSISRLTAWLRDYGGTRTEVFRGDLHSVLDASRRYHPALRKLIAIEALVRKYAHPGVNTECHRVAREVLALIEE